MKIGELAVATATKVETIRYYERIGLLPEPARTEGNYRSYGEGHRTRLAFVRHSRELGFSIKDVRSLTVVHVNRTLKALETDGLIKRQRRYLYIPDWQMLRPVAGFSELYLHVEQLAA